MQFFRLNIFIFLVIGFNKAAGQEQLGINNSNYLPSSSIFLNPSSSADSKAFMQLNLVGAGVFAFTNMAYLSKFSVWQLKSANGEVQNLKASGFKLNQFVYANAFIDGPCFVMSTKNFGAGLFVRARTVVDIRGIPYEYTDIILKQNPNPDYPQTYSINKRNIKVSNLSWLEYGGNFAWIIKKERREMISIGGNLKYLTGINVFYFNINHVKGFYNDSISQIDEIKASLRYNQPQLNSGKGMSLDFGITYKLMLENVGNYFPNSKQSHCKTVDYKYKASLCLRDAGAIQFKNNVTKGELNQSGHYRTDTGSTLTKAIITNSLNTLLYTGSVWAFVPANLVAQFDWNFENGFYANATIVKNILPLSFTGVSSANIISIAPRFEIKNFEAALPITFQKFLYPQVGLAFRIRSCVLGFDNVFPLLFKKNTYGLGVYVKVAITLFKNPSCRRGGSGVADCPANFSFMSKFIKKKANKNIKKKRWH